MAASNGAAKVRCPCGRFLFEIEGPGPETVIRVTCRDCKQLVTWTHARIVVEKRAAKTA